MNVLETLLIVAGLLHFALVWPAVMVPKVLDWRNDLAQVSRMSRHVIWVHGGFIVLVNLSFGALSIAMAGPLASGEPLARAVCSMIAVYWTSRLVLQLGLFDASEHLNNWWMRAGYHGLTVMFTYFAAIYWLAALAPGLV
jgi:hypothetical protein